MKARFQTRRAHRYHPSLRPLNPRRGRVADERSDSRVGPSGHPVLVSPIGPAENAGGCLNRFPEGAMDAEPQGGLSLILERVRAGDELARGELVTLVYDELRRVASRLMRR